MTKFAHDTAEFNTALDERIENVIAPLTESEALVAEDACLTIIGIVNQSTAEAVDAARDKLPADDLETVLGVVFDMEDRFNERVVKVRDELREISGKKDPMQELIEALLDDMLRASRDEALV